MNLVLLTAGSVMLNVALLYRYPAAAVVGGLCFAWVAAR